MIDQLLLDPVKIDGWLIWNLLGQIGYGDLVPSSRL